MQRRVALALALAFTTITAFGIIAVGARTGLFRGKSSEGAVEEFTQAWPTEPPPTATPVPPPAPAEPLVYTEYVYIDEPAPAPAPREAARAAPRAAAPQQASNQPSQVPAAEEQAPAELPTAPAMAPAQPTPAPSTAPSPTGEPTAPPAPPSGGGGEKKELEFTGTVTAISGDVVTFAHGDVSTDVRVTKGLDKLAIGTVAKVHALLVSDGYVAKEVEVKKNSGGGKEGD